MIYLDNSATSFPKPGEVASAITLFLTKVGANPGRSGHRLSVEAARVVHEARERVAALFGAADPLSVIFGQNGTYGINLALRGNLEPGDHVVTTSMEHNSVMRPLRSLERAGVGLTVVPCGADGLLDPSDLERAVTERTRMIAMTAASNVTGTVMPVAEAGRVARARGLLLMIDAAQAGGILPLDMERDGIDLLAFTGHKAMYGPPGTGGLVIGPRVDVKRMRPLLEGGTGSRSQEELQPGFLPDKFESGTPNGAGLAGLAAGIAWLGRREREEESAGRKSLLETERRLAERLIHGITEIPGARVYGPADVRNRLGVVSFTLRNIPVSEIGEILDTRFGVLCRVGLHCAPAAHRTIGTFPEGTVRLSLGAFTTEGEIDQTIEAVRKIAGEKG